MNPSFTSLEQSQDKITFVRQAILDNLTQGRDIFPSSHRGSETWHFIYSFPGEDANQGNTCLSLTLLG